MTTNFSPPIPSPDDGHLAHVGRRKKAKILVFVASLSILAILLGAIFWMAKNDDANYFLPPEDLPSLVEYVSKSVVRIECQLGETVDYGTGFSFEISNLSQGYDTAIVTNFHVIERCYAESGNLDVLYGTERKKSDDPIIRAVDPGNDLAMLEIRELVPPLYTAPFFADVGWWSMAVGNPLSFNPDNPSDPDDYIVLDNNVSIGAITSLVGERWNYTSATINNGNSGGPLVNNKGELIGINTLGSTNDEVGLWNIAVDTEVLYEKLIDRT